MKFSTFFFFTSARGSSKIADMNPNLIIDALGGTGEVSRICSVTTSAVSQWRNNGIPSAWLRYFRLAYPEVFADLDQREAA